MTIDYNVQTAIICHLSGHWPQYLIRIAGQHVDPAAISVDYDKGGGRWYPLQPGEIEIRTEGPETSMQMLQVEIQNWRTAALALAPFIRHGEDCPGEGTLRCWCGADQAQSLLDSVVKMYKSEEARRG